MKDPAALMYIDTWLSSTAEMDADCRGWYLNLILHQYDKGSLPNDIEKLAALAVVKFSEFKRFNELWEQVLKQKFKQNEDGRLENDKAKLILQARQTFKDKRSKSGNVGVVCKLAKNLGFNESEIKRLKDELYSGKIDIEQAKDEQMLKQVLKLYRIVDVNENAILNKDVNGNSVELTDAELLKPTLFNEFWKLYGKNVGKFNCERAWADIDPQEYPKILEHVPKFVKASGKYLKNPEKYLRDRGWLDDLPDYSGGEKPQEETVYPEGYDKDHDPKEGFWALDWTGEKYWCKRGIL